MEQEKNKTFIDKIWDFFASVKFAIVIFALISSTSIIGTILDQKAEPATESSNIIKTLWRIACPHLIQHIRQAWLYGYVSFMVVHCLAGLLFT